MSYGRNFQGKNYQIGMSNKEIAQKIRGFIKNDDELSRCKWSVTKDAYTIYVALLEAPFNVVTEEFEKNDKFWNTSKHFQGANSRDDRLNERTRKMLDRLEDFINSYRMDDSDPMTDYYNVNFYYYIYIGKYEKPFKICEEKAPKKHREVNTIEVKPIKADGVQMIDYTEKSIAVIGDTKPIRKKLSALGGKFNFALSCGAGWIFPKTKENLVRKALSL